MMWWGRPRERSTILGEERMVFHPVDKVPEGIRWWIHVEEGRHEYRRHGCVCYHSLTDSVRTETLGLHKVKETGYDEANNKSRGAGSERNTDSYTPSHLQFVEMSSTVSPRPGKHHSYACSLGQANQRTLDRRHESADAATRLESCLVS